MFISNTFFFYATKCMFRVFMPKKYCDSLMFFSKQVKTKKKTKIIEFQLTFCISEVLRAKKYRIKVHMFDMSAHQIHDLLSTMSYRFVFVTEIYRNIRELYAKLAIVVASFKILSGFK